MSAVAELGVREASERLGEFRVVDVREPHEFRGPLGRIAGATLAPLGALADAAGALPDDRPLLVVCRSGRRSEQGCRILEEKGRRAVNLAGGMIDWNRAGLPVERHAFETLAELRDAIAAWFAQLAGQQPAAGRAALEAALRDAGGRYDAPTAASLAASLDALAGALAQKGAPPDLELSVGAFRQALAAL
ncbi:MAG: hypothetical protein DCC71_11495 [Proteobacteria bacterium]|nr:MAG: hypothetical protein DCC71_11495 [Pseudomonadota bacterium]